MSKPDPFAAELLGKPWQMPIGDRPPALRTFLAPLPPVLSEAEQYAADECAASHDDEPAEDLG